MKISVLTPSFNSAKDIKRAIQSVMAQQYTNWEHIVVDGGSTDGTVDILASYKHLKWVSEPDKGQSDAMNKAFERSTGEVVVYLNADDELDPVFFTAIVTHFSKDLTLDMIVTNLIVKSDGMQRMRSPSIFLTEILNYWPCRFPTNPVAYAYRRSVQERVGKFPIGNHFTMDYWFLLRAYRIARIVKLDIVGGTFFIDGNNKSSDSIRAKEHLKIVRNDFLKQYYYTYPVMKYLVKTITRKLVNFKSR